MSPIPEVDPITHEMVSENDVDLIIGPKPSHTLLASRILCVDDQVFNIEFLRCQLELIPSLTGRADYAENGATAL